MKSYWLSCALLVLAYTTCGRWLQGYEVTKAIWWSTTTGFVIATAAALTLTWDAVCKFMLRGFQSDVGYSIMALMLTCLVVLSVVQFHTSAYLVLLVATSVLVRVDCLVQNLSDLQSFLVLTFLPVLGLGLSWLPHLFQSVAKLL